MASGKSWQVPVPQQPEERSRSRSRAGALQPLGRAGGMHIHRRTRTRDRGRGRSRRTGGQAGRATGGRVLGAAPFSSSLSPAVTIGDSKWAPIYSQGCTAYRGGAEVNFGSEGSVCVCVCFQQLSNPLSLGLRAISGVSRKKIPLENWCQQPTPRDDCCGVAPTVELLQLRAISDWAVGGSTKQYDVCDVSLLF